MHDFNIRVNSHIGLAFVFIFSYLILIKGDKLLVMVPSTVNNLRSLVLSVASDSGVLLEGPIGSGKTALVEYVAKATGRSSSPEFMKIQLGDQTDSKVSKIYTILHL